MATILEATPYGPNVDEAKVRQPRRVSITQLAHENSLHAKTLTLQTLVTILNSTKSSEIPNIVKSLNPDQQDTLMKYLYKGMGMPGWGDVSGSVLLGWHEKVRLQRTTLYALM